jgi:4-hydroxybenzoate polyprenyltransferase
MVKANRAPPTPLCVDLDGSLINSDLLIESFLGLLKLNPLYIFSAVFWLFQGKAYLKSRIAQKVDLAVDRLPYNAQVLALIKAEKRRRPVVLATASHIRYADAVAQHLGDFDQVLATQGDINLSGQHKADQLIRCFGAQGFDYVGNDAKDWPVWAASRGAYVVSSSDRFIAQTRRRVNVTQVIGAPVVTLKAILKAIRVHQWSKNLLLFVPFVLDQQSNLSAFLILCVSFLCLSLLASSTYILNDLLDLDADRNHETKRLRPIPAGELPIGLALLLMVLLFCCSCLCLLFLPAIFTVVAAIYLAVTLAYSFVIKAIPILDVCCLASLYTLRVIGGMLVIDAPRSFWLLAFSMFFFLSLALVKRVSELENIVKCAGVWAKGRGYDTQDIPLLSMMGVSSGYLAVLVVAFYINSDKVVTLYNHSEILWLICPLLLYWVGRVWLITSRGRMDEDPIIFAVKDRVSQLLLLLFTIVLMVAKMV